MLVLKIEINKATHDVEIKKQNTRTTLYFKASESIFPLRGNPDCILEV